MLKLTFDQIETARQVAEEIQSLEYAKDCRRRTEYRINKILAQVPEEVVRAEIARRLAEAHARLAAMGIELIPDETPDF